MQRNESAWITNVIHNLDKKTFVTFLQLQGDQTHPEAVAGFFTGSLIGIFFVTNTVVYYYKLFGLKRFKHRAHILH